MRDRPRPVGAAEPPVIAAVSPCPGSVVSGDVRVWAQVRGGGISHTHLELLRDGTWCTDATMESDAVIHGDQPEMTFDSTRFPDGLHTVRVSAAQLGGAVTTSVFDILIANANVHKVAAGVTEVTWCLPEGDVVMRVERG